MSETIEARNFIINFLRKELIGPSPGHPAVQLDGEEILRTQDSPRHRYSAGILFPMRTQATRQVETVEDETVLEESDSSEHLDTEQENTEVEHPEMDPLEVSPETDSEVTLANKYLPSAMGLTTLLEVPERILVDVSAGVYVHDELKWIPYKDQAGVERYPKAWWCRPIAQTIGILASELLGNEKVVIEKPVVQGDSYPLLVLHIVSRPYRRPRSHDFIRLITFTLVNRQIRENSAPSNSDCFFQCSFSVRDAASAQPFLAYPDRPSASDDSEHRSLELLYRHRQTFAIGHGCAAEWSEPHHGRTATVRTEVLPTFDVKPVLPTELRGVELRISDLASSDLNLSSSLCKSLADQYEGWIAKQERKIEKSSELSGALKETALTHMDNCRECLRRMREGVLLLDSDSNVARAFRLMNEAMLMQQIHYTISTQSRRTWVYREGKLKVDKPFERPSYDDTKRKWRPFQLAFILMNLKSVTDPCCPERDLVDVIWFPTGGGKTEAYLGLSAFTLFFRRIRNPNHAGTSIIMRYTLRLLTTQQFQRAASLICACGKIRQRERYDLGQKRFSIGLWAGQEVSPNRENQAISDLNKLANGQGTNKFIILSCPWCGVAMGPQEMGRVIRCQGYRKLSHPSRVRFVCDDPDCDFHSGDGLPLSVIDDHIYQSPPTLLIGTVDKFALLPFRPEARRLFGIGTTWPPPELIIQDELHLISGPLGSMVGHYETVIDALCESAHNDARTRAKIIASTATIAQSASQVKSVFGRPSFLFPPQALRAGDSFFAEERQDRVGRLYAGVFASALPSHVTAQVRTMGALLQAPRLFPASIPSVVDPYWTMMGYFSSLRELGHAATLIRADIREFLSAMWSRLGLRSHLCPDDANTTNHPRFVRKAVELTSRIQSSEVPSILQQLFTTYDGTGESAVVDVCFATNMIQVGLDVPRLGLMTITGQPKTTSEYIQASSRIGRDIERPGIVVTNYNPFKPRDRSHYEHFRTYHQSIYKHVEPTSVTAFATPVVERALHALIVILSRFLGGDELRGRPINPPDPQMVQRIREIIRNRVLYADPEEWPGTSKLFDEIINKWCLSPPPRYGDFGRPDAEMPLMYPAGTQQHLEWEDWPFQTPTSMRNVDADCAARLLRNGYGESVSL